MALQYKNIVLLIKDIEHSKQFYTDVLKQEIEYDFGVNITFKSGISIWKLTDELPVKKMLGNERLKETRSTKFELYFECENIEEMEKILKSKGVKFLHHIHEEPWGQRTLRFFDPDDHLVEVGESMYSFLNRFYFSGMTVEEVSKRTSVPVHQVKEILNINK